MRYLLQLFTTILKINLFIIISMSVSAAKFNQVTKKVIDNLEGGYYHPDMKVKNPVKFAGMGTSGETMYGIDRRHGGTLNTSEAGKKFWSLIDKAGARDKWQWNYLGGSLAPKLKELTGEIMYPHYQRLAKAYLSDKAKSVVEADDRLLFHFIYAGWNGEGWFRKFAADMNEAVNKGIKDADKLVKVAIRSRTEEGLEKGSAPNSLIRQGGLKIEKIFEGMGSGVSFPVFLGEKKQGKRSILPLIIIGGLTITAIALTIGYRKKILLLFN